MSNTKKQFKIEVQDNGKGISKEFLKQIGSLGFSSGKSNGTGYGLHYSIKTLNAFGGELSITSTEGVGTQVSILLPTVR